MKINSIMITLKAWRVRLCADVPSPVQSNCDDDSLRILYVVSYARYCRPIVWQSAAFEVGYESVSQFNREYSRFFGQPTIREIKALRDGKVAVSTAA